MWCHGTAIHCSCNAKVKLTARHNFQCLSSDMPIELQKSMQFDCFFPIAPPAILWPTPLPQVVVLNFFDDVKCHQVQVDAFSSKILPLLGCQQSTYATTASGHCNSSRLKVFIHSCQHTIAAAGWWFCFLWHGHCNSATILISQVNGFFAQATCQLCLFCATQQGIISMLLQFFWMSAPGQQQSTCATACFLSAWFTGT